MQQLVKELFALHIFNGDFYEILNLKRDASFTNGRFKRRSHIT